MTVLKRDQDGRDTKSVRGDLAGVEKFDDEALLGLALQLSSYDSKVPSVGMIPYGNRERNTLLRYVRSRMGAPVKSIKSMRKDILEAIGRTDQIDKNYNPNFSRADIEAVHTHLMAKKVAEVPVDVRVFPEAVHPRRGPKQP
jgi:hypothetical protein